MLRSLALSILFTVIASTQVMATPACSKMKIAYSENWFPLSYDTETSKANGLALDLHRNILGELEIETEFVGEIPWKRQLSMVQQGSIDALATLNFNEERAKTYTLTDPIHQFEVRAFAKEGNIPAFSKIDDLKDYRIAYSRGASYGDEFNNLAAATPLIQPINGTKKIIELLVAGRVDFIILPHHLGEKLIKDAGYSSQIKATGPVIFYQNVHLAISKKSPCAKIVEEYNKALKKLHNQKGTTG